MEALSPNLLAVLAAGLAKFMLGGLWYSPLMFDKSWRQMIGMTQPPSMSQGARAMAFELAGNMLMAYVLAHLVILVGAHSWEDGMKTGFWCWVGFIGTVSATSVVFEKKPWGLWVLNNGHQLLSALLMGAILGGWR